MQNNFIRSPLYMRCSAPVLQYMRVVDYFMSLPIKVQAKLPPIPCSYSSDFVSFDMVRLEKWYQAYIDYVFVKGKSRFLSSRSQRLNFINVWHDLYQSKSILKVV